MYHICILFISGGFPDVFSREGQPTLQIVLKSAWLVFDGVGSEDTPNPQTDGRQQMPGPSALTQLETPHLSAAWQANRLCSVCVAVCAEHSILSEQRVVTQVTLVPVWGWVRPALQKWGWEATLILHAKTSLSPWGWAWSKKKWGIIEENRKWGAVSSSSPSHFGLYHWSIHMSALFSSMVFSLKTWGVGLCFKWTWSLLGLLLEVWLSSVKPNSFPRQ